MSSKRGQKSGVDAATSNGKASITANAWAKPLKTTGPPPGMGPADKNNSKAAAAPSKKATPNKNDGGGIAIVHRERFLHCNLSLIGQKTTVSLKNGCVLEAVFHTFTPFNDIPADERNIFAFKACKIIKPPAEGENLIKDGAIAMIHVDQVVDIKVKNVNLERAATNGSGAAASTPDLITDTQISGGRGGRNRELVAAGSAWMSGGGPVSGNSRAAALAGGLEDKGGMTRKGFGIATPGGAGLQGSIGQWDQFKANEQLFNVNASFDENIYTTELDKSQIGAEKRAEAERIAREIENTTSANIHIAEERGQAVETDYDEEDRYSGVLTKEGKQRHESEKKAEEKAAPPRKMMNYAAAAAKADASKKATPPGFTKHAPAPSSAPAPVITKAKPEAKIPEEKKKEPEKPKDEKPKQDKPVEDKKPEQPVEQPEQSNEEKPAEPKNDKTDETDAKKSEDKAESEKSEKPKEVAKTSKLNANAKEFTFNPSAKSFTPSFGGGAATSNSYPAPQPQQQPQHMDPNAAMHMHGGHHMQPPHYMHAPMGQPGMMPMMNPQFAGMRYPPQYAGMDQQMAQMQQHHPQHAQAPTSTHSSGANTPTADDQNSSASAPPSAGDGEAVPQQQQQEGEASQQQASQQQPQQQIPQQQTQMQMPYNVPQPGGYYPGAMPMPRGPGYPPHQFVGAPQQMPGVGPGGAPYRQMYPMQPGMPPNMHMRGPPQYYSAPNGPMPYPPNAYHGRGMMDENDPNFRGGRGRGPGRGRGRRAGRGRGPGGRGNYQQYGGPNASGQQQQPGEGESGGVEPNAQDRADGKDDTAAVEQATSS